MDFSRVVSVLALAVAAFLPFVGIAQSPARNVKKVFGASFNEGYRAGDRLCDTGAVNGTWGVVPDGAAVATEDAAKGIYMACSVANERLVFSPYSVSEKKLNVSSASVHAEGYEGLSGMPAPEGARAAFSICTVNSGETNYMGWVCAQNCWTNLYPSSGGLHPVPGEWHEVAVRFLKTDAGREYAQYWLKRESDADYVPLKTAEGVSWIDVGKSLNAEMLGKVEITGDGGLEWLLGAEPRRGLILGIASWYDFLFDESIYNQCQGSSWDNVSSRTRSDALRSYIVNVERGVAPVTYNTSRTHTKAIAEVTEFEVQFTGPNDDDSIPEDACARIRIVDAVDQAYHFACLVKDQWKTNMQWRINTDAKYTVEITLDNGKRTVSYRFKEGYGLEGGAYRDLFLDEPMQTGASGKTLNIDFEGYGVVHEIRGKDKTL